jgi:outer membrane lipoprotein
MTLRRITVILAFAASLALAACAPILDRKYMDEGSREVSFAALREHPDQYEGKLFIMGGVIVRTRFTDEGSLIEAMHVPVDRYGEFESAGRSEGRYLAVMPKEERMLDPVIYRKGRRITLAGEFIGTRSGRIEEMEYAYPVFRIRQIVLWPHQKQYDRPLFWYDPWFTPYPYFYRHPWWYYPQRYAPVPVQPPVSRRPPPTRKKGEEERKEKRGERRLP